jgi:hypothetical protein
MRFSITDIDAFAGYCSPVEASDIRHTVAQCVRERGFVTEEELRNILGGHFPQFERMLDNPALFESRVQQRRSGSGDRAMYK